MTRFCTHIIGGLVLIGTMTVPPARAQTRAPQTGAPYFHEAAQQYIDANLQQALATVNEGLRVTPDDARLRALREKIQQQRQQSGGESDQSQQPQQGGRRPQNASNQDGEQRGQGQQSSEPSDKSNRQQQDAQGQSGGQEQQEGTSAENADERGSASGATRQEQGSELSQAQAARILRALEAQEKQLLRQVQKRRRIPQRILKEW